ncbi:MAG: hypothetical protein HZC40_00260 [Chloroflexi bacterium]|nr:hypothetical protein [Chloroflexota bacterium]
MPDPFEEEYLDVLHNIETALAHTYAEHTEMTDWDAREGVHALMRAYKAEARGRAAPTARLNAFAQDAYKNVQVMCDWRLGRATLLTEDGKPPDVEMSPKTVDEIILCLQRILRSIEMWQKEGGRRGYYNFVREFVG